MENSPASIIVTHHIEEIPVGTTHALLLKDGADFASGEIAQVITSINLNSLFNVNVEVRNEDGRYTALSKR